MTTDVSSLEFVLNGTLVPASSPQTRKERRELNLVAHMISHSLLHYVAFLCVRVENGAITVVAPLETEDSLRWGVMEAIRKSRHGGLSLYDSDAAIDDTFKNVRAGVLEVTGKNETELLRRTIKLAEHCLRDELVRARKQDLVNQAKLVTSMLRTILLGIRTG